MKQKSKNYIVCKKSGVYVQPIIEGNSEYSFNVPAGIRCVIVLPSLRPSQVSATVSVHLSGEEADATILGVFVLAKRSVTTLRTMQYHECANTTSNLLVKTVLYDEASCKIEGGIRVEKGAQKTNAYQKNENLLLSDRVQSVSSPSLEILADDVRCTHGATISPISEDEVWYLSSRGIPKERARNLIVMGFLESALQSVEDEVTKQRLLQDIQNAVY